MVTKVLNIEVRDDELNELNKDLGRVRGNMDAVEGSSKKADGALKKVGDNGGAISTLDAFTGGLATRIRDAAEATKVFNFSLRATKTALIATGIGAFVVALGLVITYWEDIVDLVQGTNRELDDQIELLHRKNELLKDSVEQLELEEKLLGLQGKSTDEIVKKKIEALQAQIGLNGAELVNLQIKQARLKAQREELNLAERLFKGAVSATQGLLQITVGNKSTLVKAIYGDVEDLQEVEDKINEINKTILNAQIQLQEIRNGENADTQTGRADVEKVDVVLPTTGVTLTQLQELGQQEFDALALQQTARTRLEEANAAVRREIAEREAQAKVESYMLAANGFAAASELIGRETAAGKAFAVASTLISTYLSAQQAYQSQIAIPTPDAPFRATLAAAVAVAAGLANVKQILSTKIPGGYGSSGSIGASPSIPPAFNVVGTSPQNQLNQALVQQNNQPVQAYVVEGEVTTAEQMRRGKIVASSIG